MKHSIFDEYDADGLSQFAGRPDEHGIYPIGSGFLLKMERPYSYEPFYLYNNGAKANRSLYTDRLSMWDKDKTLDALFRQVWGEEKSGFGDSTYAPVKWSEGFDKVEQFLNLYIKKPVKLCAVAEFCNVSNGYPTWLLTWKE